jgi:hypothetical protein
LTLFGQSSNFNHEFLCFEANFIDSIQPNDTLKATITKTGCSPIEFKQTGEFFRVKGYPNFICGKGVRLRMIPKNDKLKGTWSFNDNVLTMKTKKKMDYLPLTCVWQKSGFSGKLNILPRNNFCNGLTV